MMEKCKHELHICVFVLRIDNYGNEVLGSGWHNLFRGMMMKGPYNMGGRTFLQNSTLFFSIQYHRLFCLILKRVYSFREITVKKIAKYKNKTQHTNNHL